MDLNHHYMRRALELAEYGRFTARPNPVVGCVIVQNNHIVGEGYHHYFGGAHAEINALNQAGNLAQGATCYLTLEPCNHHGKTPPCAPALVKAGIKKVFIATADDNSLVAGQGIHHLESHGLEVHIGILAEEARWQNRAFFKRMQSNRPWVTAKLALSLDSKIADYTGKSQWISGPTSRSFVQQLRAASDAIMVGSDTVLADDPQLSVREFDFISDDDKPSFKSPLKIIIDSTQRISKTAQIFSTPGDTFVYHHHDLEKILSELASQHQANQILVEGGGKLIGSLLSSNLVDELVLFQCGLFLGNAGITGFAIAEELAIAKAHRWQLKETQTFGNDVMTRWIYNSVNMRCCDREA